MSLKIYNSLTRKKEDFIPVEKGKVKMYVCGMTVYSDAHIGHARTYFAFDVIRRYLEYKGLKVTYVQNITDVDDKIIAAANREGVDALEYSQKYTDICLKDLDDLGIRRADIYPKASETIPDMIEMTQKIIDNGYGYVSDGDVYFSVEKFSDYGKLSGQRLDDLMSGVRKDPTDKKQNPFDFALWKSVKPGEPSWDSPWGPGRPGWHIECSAMSKKLLDLPFDIHGGGMDLRFPHHENEIAQAEAAHGCGFARFWMHIGLLTVEGEKMSKSIGNIINVKDLLKEWDAEVVRFFFAQAHYRSPPDFSKKGLENAQKGLDRIRRVYERLSDLSDSDKVDVDSLSEEGRQYFEIVDEFRSGFGKSMDDDINTPEAIGLMFEFINKTNKFLEENKSYDKGLCKYAFDALVELGKILTLFQDISNDGFDDELLSKVEDLVQKYGGKAEVKEVGKLLDVLLMTRQDARKNKDWGTSDGIRDDLNKLGFEIQDTNDGPIWRKKK